jgi:hypothetical protein
VVVATGSPLIQENFILGFSLAVASVQADPVAAAPGSDTSSGLILLGLRCTAAN